MRHIFNLSIIVVLLMSLVGCTIADGGSRSTEPLAKIIWQTSKSHIAIVNDAIEDVIRASEVHNIADMDERAEYASRYFDGAQMIVEQSNGFKIIKQISEDRHSSWVVTTNGHAFGEGEWTIERESGNGYKMVVTPTGEGEFEANVEFDNGSQSGSADIEFSYQFEDYELDSPDLVCTLLGEINVVDCKSQSSKPLYVNTKITDSLKISSYNGLLQGELMVECIDKLYDVSDSITVSILTSKNYVVVTCYGEGYQFYNERMLY